MTRLTAMCPSRLRRSTQVVTKSTAASFDTRSAGDGAATARYDGTSGRTRHRSWSAPWKRALAHPARGPRAALRLPWRTASSERSAGAAGPRREPSAAAELAGIEDDQKHEVTKVYRPMTYEELGEFRGTEDDQTTKMPNSVDQQQQRSVY